MCSDLATADSRVEPHLAYCAQFEVGGISVAFAGIELSRTDLGAALERFSVARETSDIEVKISRTTALVPNTNQPLFDSAAVWRLYETVGGFQFDFSSPVLGQTPYKRLMIDRHFRRGTLQLSEVCFSGFPFEASPLEYPLDELLIMHRLTQEKAVELHGTGIVRADGVGNLFVGHSGAGKSTTTRLWTAREDVQVLSDDRIIVRRNEVASVARTPCQAADSVAEDRVLRLRDRPALPTGRSAQDDSRKKMRMYGTPWHGEAMYASPNSAPLARIFVLEHGYGNVIRRLAPGQAVAELFARSFVPFHRHEYVESALAFLEEVVDSVPVYRYAFEPDERAVEKIIHFHD